MQCLTLLGGVCLFADSECSADIKLQPEQMTRLLQQAVDFNKIAVAQVILNWKQDAVKQKDAEGWNPLHLAAKTNATTMIHILCDKTAETEATTNRGNTPLLVAALTGSEEAVTALLAKKASPKASNRAGWTPVHYAAAADNAQMIQMLHQHGGELHNKTRSSNSPLSLAIMNDSERAAALLMQICSTLGNWKNSNNWTALHLAASKDAPNMVQILTGSAGVDLNALNDKGNTPLAVAVFQGCLQVVEVLLEADANPDISNKKGWRALHFAAQQDACDVVHLLCEAGANTENQTNQGNTPLCVAAMHGCSDATAELLKQKANPNVRNVHGWSAIHYSAAASASEIIRHISQADGVDMDLKTDKENTALLIAVTHDAKGAAKVLVDAGADANVKGPEDWAALHFAVKQDDQEFIDILCNGGADVNAMCSGSKTPLMLAVMKALVKSVRSLLHKCADPNLRDAQGWSALHMAVDCNETVEILQLLIDNRACVDTLTNKGNTALALAVLKNSIKSAEALLLGKADPNACGDHLWSPLHLAAEKNYTKMVELLCSFDANPNVTNHQGYTPLVISVAKGYKEVADTLLRNSANPSIQSELNGWSALHFAAQEDNHVLGEMLCSFNANLNARTHTDNAPLLIAALKQSKHMMSTLLIRKADANASDSHGWTALHCVAQANASEMVPLLCAFSADCEAKTSKGNTPLAIAVIHNADLAAQELVYWGANVNSRNCDGWTPLCCAIYKGSVDTKHLECLCSPTNVSMPTNQHGYPLDLCGHNIAYANCLLKHGAQRSHQLYSCPVAAFTIAPVGSMTAPSLPNEGHDGPNMKGHPTSSAKSIELEIIDTNVNSPIVAVRNIGTSESGSVTGELAVLESKGGLDDSHSSNVPITNSDIVDKDGNAPIHIAARDGDKDLVKSILARSAEVANMPGEKGYLPIQFAAMGGQPLVIELLSHHCNAKSITDRNGYTLLHLAAKRNQAHVVDYLLQDGHRPDAKDGNGYCPIHVAALDGCTAVIRVFLQYDIGMLSLKAANNRYTVLHCAAERGKANVVEFICSNYPGASVNAEASPGETPLHVASIHKTGNAEVIKALLKFGAEIKESDGSKDTPLHYAVLREDEEKARTLLSAYPNLATMAGASGETPLHWAVKRHGIQKYSGNLVTGVESRMLDILCESSSDISPGDQYGNTPLHFAVAYISDEATVQQLLAKGADPEKENKEGLTPLDFAASKDARNCFVDMYNKAQEDYDIKNVFYDMHRVHEYVKHHQMDKAGMLMCKCTSDVQ